MTCGRVRLSPLACALLACAAWAAGDEAAAGAASRVAPGVSRAQGDARVDIRLRSFAPGASGVLTVEPSEGGGHFRLTALGLPDPQTQSRAARAYVVWASSEGRIVRLGGLLRDERGNGGLAFERPAGLERFSVIVTAESGADAERLTGAPVLSTRAGEARALYPAPAPPAPPALPTPPTPVAAPATATTDERGGDASDSAAAPPPPDAPAAPARRGTRPRRSGRVGDFYTEVDDALVARGGGRVVEFEGERETPAARGTARATVHANSAYVRAHFRGVPLPSTIGAGVYVLWAIVPDGRIIYMGSLPATQDLNRAQIYVRTREFGSDDFNLFVTAERQRPAANPSERRVMTPRDAKFVVK